MAADGKNYKTDCTNTEGRMAGNARRTFEKDRGKPVISTDNYLTLNKSDKSDELLEGDK